MGATSIQWTDAVWNPVRGCSRISPGCEHCYAETMAARFSGPGQWAHGIALRSPARWTRKVEPVPEMLDAPLHWKKPRRIFVNSMSDLFHEDVPAEFIEQVFAVMANAPQHTFQILTKRAKRMAQFFGSIGIGRFGMNVRGAAFRMKLPTDSFRWPLPNVWLGVSVEDQQRADERIPHLLRTPAAVRFLSCEPLLGPVTLDSEWLNIESPEGEQAHASWCIVGGESGPGARPMDLGWARSIVQQCRAAGVAVFCKQLGKVPVEASGGPSWRYPLKLDRAHGGNPAEWPADLRVREFPEERR